MAKKEAPKRINPKLLVGPGRFYGAEQPFEPGVDEDEDNDDDMMMESGEEWRQMLEDMRYPVDGDEDEDDEGEEE
ncbi:hypothetical protein LTR09_007449 [Extremus antarcticus]|uniref:Uncharacterized protein n=1 Tax=Extremus antarcticus TaxID=702011 RepID=A0AAJ0DCH4_9PEZI|nr:hypothetical protein LTR09_007449 [Extremus antarcticus]